MSGEESSEAPFIAINTVSVPAQPTRPWIWRRICSQNPFYLLSVCFALHGLARWVHTDTGQAFSPWPLLALTAGYTLLLAVTGYVIVRYGRVWDDARSILLLILLLFVEMSLTFDDTLVRDPATGRLLLLAGLTFAVAVSELLLRGLRIGLPWLFRMPYHAMLALLYLYPILLTNRGPHGLSTMAISWGIFLFPAISALLLLTLLPAIRRGSAYTRDNGTPWMWPWYPWSLFVFLAVCLGFRAYALSLSFDPVVSLTLDAAMQLESAFGTYYLVPLVLAAGFLLLEIGLVEKRRVAVEIALLVPLLCVGLSVPNGPSIGPHQDFLRMLLSQVGSPVWLTFIAAIVFQAYAMIRGVRSAEVWLVLTAFVATRIGPQTIDIVTLVPTQWWPALLLGGIQLAKGLQRKDSHRVFVGVAFAVIALSIAVNESIVLPKIVQFGGPVICLTAAVLITGAVFDDEFAWFLKVIGAPLLVAMTVATGALIHVQEGVVQGLAGILLIQVWAVVAFAYGRLVRMPLYRLSALVCFGTASSYLAEMAVVALIRESGWNGATSFAAGLGWFVLAVAISSWKAGWLNSAGRQLRSTLTLEVES